MLWPTTIIVHHKILKNEDEMVSMDILGADVTIKGTNFQKKKKKIAKF
jgi:hypothetical protein